MGGLKHARHVAVVGALAAVLLTGGPPPQSHAGFAETIGEVDRLLGATDAHEKQALLKALDALYLQLAEPPPTAPAMPSLSQESPATVVIGPPRRVTGDSNAPPVFDPAEQRRRTLRTYRGVATPDKEEGSEPERRGGASDTRRLVREIRNDVLRGESREVLMKRWSAVSQILRQRVRSP